MSWTIDSFVEEKFSRSKVFTVNVPNSVWWSVEHYSTREAAEERTREFGPEMKFIIEEINEEQVPKGAEVYPILDDLENLLEDDFDEDNTDEGYF